MTAANHQPASPTTREQGRELRLIFGTGPAGTTLSEILIAHNKRVYCVNRSGKANLPPGVEVQAGDALDLAAVRELCKDAAVVYHCANVLYPQQVELMPRFGANITEGAARANAKLVVLDTLYMYGKTHGVPMMEGTPYAATTRKGRMRAQLAEGYLAAYEAGTVRVTLGRAADFYGPRVLNSALGDRVFPLCAGGQADATVRQPRAAAQLRLHRRRRARIGDPGRT